MVGTSHNELVLLAYHDYAAGHIARPNDGTDPECFVVWAKLFALTEMLCDVETKNTIARTIFEKRPCMWNHPHEAAKMSRIVYESSPPRCPMQRLVADITIVHCRLCRSFETNTALKAALSDLTKEILVDVMLKEISWDPYTPCTFDRLQIDDYLETLNDSYS
jgi:hypothetical protein